MSCSLFVKPGKKIENAGRGGGGVPCGGVSLRAQDGPTAT